MGSRPTMVGGEGLATITYVIQAWLFVEIFDDDMLIVGSR